MPSGPLRSAGPRVAGAPSLGGPALRGPLPAPDPGEPGAREAGLRSEAGGVIPGVTLARVSGTVPDRAADERKEAVRRATDLVALVERTLPLRRSGRSFSACCPFHSERTPSFHVWPESQRWKCFSCGRSGDAFSFVMEREGVEFPEALRMLARDAGIEIDRPDPSAAAAARSKDAAYAACEFACRWFQGNLKGSPAADYLRGRGLDGAVAYTLSLHDALPI